MLKRPNRNWVSLLQRCNKGRSDFHVYLHSVILPSGLFEPVIEVRKRGVHVKERKVGDSIVREGGRRREYLGRLRGRAEEGERHGIGRTGRKRREGNRKRKRKCERKKRIAFFPLFKRRHVSVARLSKSKFCHFFFRFVRTEIAISRLANFVIATRAAPGGVGELRKSVTPFFLLFTVSFLQFLHQPHLPPSLLRLLFLSSSSSFFTSSHGCFSV